MTGYIPSGIIQHSEAVYPGPGGTILHTYWDDRQNRYIREMYTREEWEKMLDD